METQGQEVSFFTSGVSDPERSQNSTAASQIAMFQLFIVQRWEITEFSISL